MSDDPVMAALARIEDAQVRMEAHLDAIDDRLHGIDGRLGKIETGQAGFRQDMLDELGKTRTAIMEKVAELEAEVRDIKGTP
jgi:hypothetical protein